MYYKRFKIKDKEDYKKLQKRLEKGKRYLEGRWFDKKYIKDIERYEAMALACLNYEIENDLLKI